jgi:hypothetical protein
MKRHGERSDRKKPGFNPSVTLMPSITWNEGLDIYIYIIYIKRERELSL